MASAKIPKIAVTPGETLAFRLPREESPGGWAIGCLSFTLPIVAVTIWAVYTWGWEGFPVFLSIVSAIFSLIAVILVYQWIRDSRLAQTIVEVSAHPLVIGSEFEYLISQPGRFALESCLVELCQLERVTYREGTSTRSEEKVVQTIVLLDKADEAPAAGEEGLQIQQTHLLAESLMPTFYATHNEIKWRIRIKIDIAGWSPITRNYNITLTAIDEDELSSPAEAGNEY